MNMKICLRLLTIELESRRYSLKLISQGNYDYSSADKGWIIKGCTSDIETIEAELKVLKEINDGYK